MNWWTCTEEILGERTFKMRGGHFFSMKWISLVIKSVLLAKNTFCYIHNIIMCTLGISGEIYDILHHLWCGLASEGFWSPIRSSVGWISGFLDTGLLPKVSFSFLWHECLLGIMFTACVHRRKMLYMLFPSHPVWKIGILKFYNLLSQKTKTKVFNLMLENLVQEIDAFYESSTSVHIQEKDFYPFVRKRKKINFGKYTNIFVHCATMIDYSLVWGQIEIRLEHDHCLKCPN